MQRSSHPVPALEWYLPRSEPSLGTEVFVLRYYTRLYLCFDESLGPLPLHDGVQHPPGKIANESSIFQVQIVQGPNGQLTVRGLQPGQQLLKLPDGRLQLVNMNQQKPISLPASGQAVQKIMIQAAPTGQPGGTGQRFIQIRPALPVGTQHLPTTTVRAVKIIQAAQPAGSPVVSSLTTDIIFFRYENM